MRKNVLKSAGLGLGIVFLGAVAIFGIGYVRYQTSDEYRALKEIEKLKKEYAEDPYGGDTPEETLRLFIDALKKGDTDLATRFFVIDKQDEWKEDLALTKDKNLLPSMIDEAQRLRLSKKDEKQAFFTLANADNIVEVQVILRRVSNGRWKIQEL